MLCFPCVLLQAAGTDHDSLPILGPNGLLFLLNQTDSRAYSFLPQEKKAAQFPLLLCERKEYMTIPFIFTHAKNYS